MTQYDNIMSDFLEWRPLCRFIILRYNKQNTLQIDHESTCVVDDPVVAYVAYCQLKQSEFDIQYEWKLQDSFGKDALDFCKDQTEKFQIISAEGAKR